MMKDYAEYVEAEVATNRRKFHVISFSHAEVATIARLWFSEREQHARGQAGTFALCEGIRNGAELRAFSQALRCRTVGTDISPTVLRVPDGFLCDFHECPALWRGRVSFLYSNAWDHSYDLDKLLDTWHSLVCVDGMVCLQHTPNSGADSGGDVEDLFGRVTRRFRDVKKVEVLPPTPVLALWWLLPRRVKLLASPFPPLPGPWPSSQTTVVYGRK